MPYQRLGFFIIDQIGFQLGGRIAKVMGFKLPGEELEFFTGRLANFGMAWNIRLVGADDWIFFPNKVDSGILNSPRLWRTNLGWNKKIRERNI